MGQYTPFLCTCGCGCAPSNCKKIHSDQVVYWGPAIACLNIDYTKNFTDITQIFAGILCTLTTTTTLSSTTTTTTTIANCRYIDINVTQVANFPPTVVVIKSTFGETSVDSFYDNVGQYTITFNGPVPFMGDNTIILSGANNNPVSAGVFGAQLFLNTFQPDCITPTDDVLAQVTSFHIEHCSVLP